MVCWGTTCHSSCPVMAKGATSGTKPFFTQKFLHLTFLYFSFSFIVLELILINSYSFVGSPKQYLGAPTSHTWPTFQFSLCSEDCQGHLALGILGGGAPVLLFCWFVLVWGHTCQCTCFLLAHSSGSLLVWDQIQCQGSKWGHRGDTVCRTSTLICPVPSNYLVRSLQAPCWGPPK